MFVENNKHIISKLGTPSHAISAKNFQTSETWKLWGKSWTSLYI